MLLNTSRLLNACESTCLQQRHSSLKFHTFIFPSYFLTPQGIGFLSHPLSPEPHFLFCFALYSLVRLPRRSFATVASGSRISVSGARRWPRAGGGGAFEVAGGAFEVSAAGGPGSPAAEAGRRSGCLHARTAPGRVETDGGAASESSTTTERLRRNRWFEEGRKRTPAVDHV